MSRRRGWPRLSLALLVATTGFGIVAPLGLFGNVPDDERNATRAGVRQDYPRECRAFWKWVRATIVPRRTTRAEVLALLGRKYVPLDRPGRDGLTTIEYYLSALGVSCGAGEELIYFDFDSRQQVVAYRPGLSLSFCGFCPHVFAHDGRWRLEGKMLAGCVGEGREGADTLLLPRLTPKDRHLRVRLSNLAPEVEFIDQVKLGWVSLGAGEELDVGPDGAPFVWKPARQVNVRLDDRTPAREDFVVDVTGNQALVLEVRNTTEFETALRDHLLHGRPAPAAALTVRFEDGREHAVPPVGTKFLRRVVIAVPAGARSARVHAPGPFWLVRRLWLGSGRAAEDAVVWQTPVMATGPQTGAASLLQDRDGVRLRLRRGQDADLTFFAPLPAAAPRRWGYVLRMVGYYDFLPEVRLLP